MSSLNILKQKLIHYTSGTKNLLLLDQYAKSKYLLNNEI